MFFECYNYIIFVGVNHCRCIFFRYKSYTSIFLIKHCVINLFIVYFQNDEPALVKTCYNQIKHKEGDVVKMGDCVLIKSGPKKTDLPYVAKVATLWEDDETGN